MATSGEGEAADLLRGFFRRETLTRLGKSAAPPIS